MSLVRARSPREGSAAGSALLPPPAHDSFQEGLVVAPTNDAPFGAVHQLQGGVGDAPALGLAPNEVLAGDAHVIQRHQALASLHNLMHMTQMMADLRGSIAADEI